MSVADLMVKLAEGSTCVQGWEQRLEKVESSALDYEDVDALLPLEWISRCADAAVWVSLFSYASDETAHTMTLCTIRSAKSWH